MEKEDSVMKDEIIGFLQKSLLTTLLTDLCLQEYRIISLRRIKSLGIGGSGSNYSNSFLATPKILIDVASSGNNSRSSSPGGKKDTSALCDCLNCGRQIAFSRYASHLSQCMDLKNGSRSRRTPGGFNASSNGLKKRSTTGSNSPYPSDDDGERNKNIVKLTSGKRAGSPVGSVNAAAIASLKFKKLKPNPASSPTQISHPLSKSLSLPPQSASSTTSLSSTAAHPISTSSPTSTKMAAHNSLPHSLPLKPVGVATKSPRPPSVNQLSNANGSNHNLSTLIPSSKVPSLSNSDRPDSDSSEDDTSEEEKRKAASRSKHASKAPKKSGSAAAKRGIHPLAKGIDHSASENSDSEGSSD